MSGDDGDNRRNIIRDDGGERCDIGVDDGRCGSRSQDTSHSSSRKHGETVDGYLRGGYRFQTSHPPPPTP